MEELRRLARDHQANVVWLDLDKPNLEAVASVQKFDLAPDLEAAGEVSEKFRPCEADRVPKGGVRR